MGRTLDVSARISTFSPKYLELRLVRKSNVFRSSVVLIRMSDVKWPRLKQPALITTYYVRVLLEHFVECLGILLRITYFIYIFVHSYENQLTCENVKKKLLSVV